MNNAALAGAAIVTFTLTNNQIGTGDLVLVTVSGGIATAGTYAARCLDVAAGSATIQVTNLSGGSLSESVVLNFMTFQILQA
jgi:hypothetical protein